MFGKGILGVGIELASPFIKVGKGFIFVFGRLLAFVFFLCVGRV